MSKRPAANPSAQPISRASFLRLMVGAAGVLGAGAVLGTGCGANEGDRDAGEHDHDHDHDGGHDAHDGGQDHEEHDGGHDEHDAGHDDEAHDAGHDHDDHDAGHDEPDAGEDPRCTSPIATIGSNHGHVLVVPLADIQAGTQKTYDITGSSGHAHAVTLTAAHMTQLQNGAVLNLTSTSGGGHTHPATVRCEA